MPQTLPGHAIPDPTTSLRRARWPHASGLALVAGAALLATVFASGSTLAQDASPAPAVTAATADEAVGPELTWAPLVTPPPLATPPISTPTDQANGFSVGAADAPVLVEIWEDFQCPFCQRWTFQVKPMVVEQYVNTGKARLVFRNLAFLGDESHWAAVAASLAADQNLFWPYHDYLYSNLRGENVGSYELDRLLEIGQVVGLDMDAFREGLALENARQRFAELDAQSRADASVLGIGATPTVVVAGVPLESPDLETVSAAIDEALAAVSGEEPAESIPAADASPGLEASPADQASPAPAG
jgi:protein-disulfide isomerase